MSKKFKKIIMANSNEVSLCSKYNSGANKQTEFEIVKDKEATKDSNMKQVIENLIKFTDFYSTEEVKQEYDAFKDFLNYWLEYDVNNCYYNLLSEALQNALSNIKYREDITKEEKVLEYQKLFDMFIEEYKKMPITKNSDGKYEVSLVSKSHIQDTGINPQNETDNITKEKTGEMEKEQLNVIQKAFDVIKSALGLEKTETPSEETPEVQPEVETTVEEVTEEPTVEEPTVEEAPVVKEEVEETPVEEEKVEETPVEEEVEEAVEEPTVEEAPVEEAVEEPTVEEAPVEEPQAEITEEIDKSTTDLIQQLAEMKKAKEEAEEKIEKMSFIQKAKDEFSMLVGTPEEIGEKLYSISKSNLETEVKDFIMNQLKKVSDKNSELTQEMGSITKDSGDMTDEDKIYAEAERIAKAENISVNKALRKIK